MTLEERFPRHPLTTKKIGDRVKVPRFATDESRGYDYGTVHHVGPDDNLYIIWDEKTPYLSRRTNILCAILV